MPRMNDSHTYSFGVELLKVALHALIDETDLIIIVFFVVVGGYFSLVSIFLGNKAYLLHF